MISKIRKEFEKEGYKLLVIEYKNNKIPLLCECPKGHQNRISYNNFKNGTRCRKCSYELRGKKNRHSLDYVKNIFKKEGYELLDTEYKNNRKKLNYICPEGHNNKITLSMFTRGNRCPTCYNNRRGFIKTLSYDYIKSEFNKRGYKLISDIYVNCTEKLMAMCPDNHKIAINWADFSQGHGCRKCGNKRISKALREDFKVVKESFEKEGYGLLTKKYINSKQKLNYICPKGHIGSTNFNNWKDKNTRCSICFIESSRSKMEIELFEFLQQYFTDIKTNDRKIISPLELDIVIPSKKIAVEFCGIFWHNEENNPDNKYHLNKLEKCNNAGYSLITIFEDEWVNKKDIVKSRLKNILRINNNYRVYARNCKIKEIDSITKNIFLNEYHIQGTDRARINLGAFYKDNLVSTMTFSKPSISKGAKKNKENIYELSRFCSHNNYNVVGIASKLLSYFIKNYKVDKIISYADRRWSVGNLYKTLGFLHEHNSKPNYWYVVGNIRKHRFNFRKNVLHKKLEYFNSKFTEVENMKMNGYYRIFDCGNSKWKLLIK